MQLDVLFPENKNARDVQFFENFLQRQFPEGGKPQRLQAEAIDGQMGLGKYLNKVRSEFSAEAMITYFQALGKFLTITRQPEFLVTTPEGLQIIVRGTLDVALGQQLVQLLQNPPAQTINHITIQGDKNVVLTDIHGSEVNLNT